MKPKIIRASTVSMSLDAFCKGVLYQLSNRYEVLGLSSPDSLLHEVGHREGVRVIGVPMERRISLIKDLRSLWQLYRVFCREKPDMVHSMTPKAGMLCMIAARMTRVPVRVHTFTGLVWPTETGLKRKILMLTDWITCACATHVVPEGYGVLNDLKAHKITSKTMRVLGYGNVRGIDLFKYSRRDEVIRTADQIKKEDTFTFVFVGRIVGDKGINELVHAFVRFRAKSEENGMKCRLILVGQFEDHLDPVSDETRKMIASILEIEAVGPKSGDELLAYYAASDCFVFPSYREGFPNTVIEAGAMEIASIVSDINGSREIIRPTQSSLKGEDLSGCNSKLNPGERMSIRENGVVIPSKDVDALYDAMLWMMEHAEERQKMGKRAREIVAERWEQGFVREKLYEFYREVLGK